MIRTMSKIRGENMKINKMFFIGLGVILFVATLGGLFSRKSD
jgi:hypothetical protein